MASRISTNEDYASEDYSDDNDSIDEEEFQKALALNEQLRQLMLAQEQGSNSAQGMHSNHQSQENSTMSSAKRQNFTFKETQLKQMGRDNQRLVKRMVDIKVGKAKDAGFSHNDMYTQHRKEASQSINRRKREDQIARENNGMANRLNNVKSSMQHNGPTSRRSSGYTSKPWTKTNGRQKMIKPAVLVQPEWNDR